MRPPLRRQASCRKNRSTEVDHDQANQRRGFAASVEGEAGERNNRADNGLLETRLQEWVAYQKPHVSIVDSNQRAVLIR